MSTMEERQTAVSLQQVCWPDDQHRFPWDEGYSLPIGQQLLIGRPSGVGGSR